MSGCTEAETPFGQLYCANHGEYWPCAGSVSPEPGGRGEPELALPDSDQLRDELGGWLVQNFFWGIHHGRGVEAADMLLSGPLRQILREHTERGEALERVRALADQWESRGLVPMGHYATRAVRRALDGTP